MFSAAQQANPRRESGQWVVSHHFHIFTGSGASAGVPSVVYGATGPYLTKVVLLVILSAALISHFSFLPTLLLAGYRGEGPLIHCYFFCPILYTMTFAV